MKMPYFSTFFLLVVFMLLLSDVCAEDSTQWKLPEGAIARLGKGWINDVKYFRDGSRFAVASSIWVMESKHREASENPRGAYLFGQWTRIFSRW